MSAGGPQVLSAPVLMGALVVVGEDGQRARIQRLVLMAPTLANQSRRWIENAGDIAVGVVVAVTLRLDRAAMNQHLRSTVHRALSRSIQSASKKDPKSIS